MQNSSTTPSNSQMDATPPLFQSTAPTVVPTSSSAAIVASAAAAGASIGAAAAVADPRLLSQPLAAIPLDPSSNSAVPLSLLQRLLSAPKGDWSSVINLYAEDDFKENISSNFLSITQLRSVLSRHGLLDGNGKAAVVRTLCKEFARQISGEEDAASVSRRTVRRVQPARTARSAPQGLQPTSTSAAAGSAQLQAPGPATLRRAESTIVESDSEQGSDEGHRTPDPPQARSARSPHASPSRSSRLNGKLSAGLQSLLRKVPALPPTPSRSAKKASSAKGEDSSRRRSRRGGKKSKHRHRSRSSSSSASSSSSSDSISDSSSNSSSLFSSSDVSSASSSSVSSADPSPERRRRHRHSRKHSRRHRSSGSSRRSRELLGSAMDKPIAKTVLRNMLKGRSSSSVFECVTQDISQSGITLNQHSRNELQALARIIDSLLAKDSKAAIELAVRRLVGVHAASKSGNWGVADALDQNTPSLSWLGSRLNSQCAKISARILNARGASDASASGGSNGTRNRDTSKFRASDYKKPVTTSRDESGASGSATKSTKPAGSNKK